MTPEGLSKVSQEVSLKENLFEAADRADTIRKWGLLPIATALALTTISTYKEGSAQAAEVTPGMTWEEGFNALRDDVFTNPNEQAAYVIVKKDGTVYWSGSTAGQRGRVLPSTKTITEALGREAPGSLQGLCSFHTHPPRSGGLISIDEKRVLGNRATTFSVPPSGGDVGATKVVDREIRALLERSNAYTVDVIFDPSRVWRHRIATDSDLQKSPIVWNELATRRANSEKYRSHIETRLAAFSESELDQFIALLGPEDSRFIKMVESNRGKIFSDSEVIQSKKSAVQYALIKNNVALIAAFFKNDTKGADLQKLWYDALKEVERESDSWNDVVYGQWVPASYEGKLTQDLYKKLQEAYLRLGVVLESFTYEEVAKDPLKLCKWPER